MLAADPGAPFLVSPVPREPEATAQSLVTDRYLVGDIPITFVNRLEK